MAERELAASPDSLAAHYAAVASAFMRREPSRMLSSYERFLRAVEAKQEAHWNVTESRLAGRIAEQFVRMCEAFLAEGGQSQFEPAQLSFVADQALVAEHWASAADDTATAAAARTAADHFWQFDGRGALRTFWRPAAPPHLQLEPTNHCNLKCTMCPRTTVMGRRTGYMDIEVWDRVLDTWGAREITLAFEDPLTGAPLLRGRMGGTIKLFYLGELLMHPEFDRFITIARERNAVVALLTNGILLQKRSVRRRLLEARPSSLGISLDGYDADSYERIRDGGQWEAVKAAIEAFIAERDAMGLRDEISLHINNVNPGYSPEILAKANAFLGSIASGSIPIRYLKLTTTNPSEHLSPDGEKATYDFSPAYVVTPDRPSCLEPLDKMQILWDGRVSACCLDSDGEIELGHVRNGVDTVWQSEPMRRIQRAHLEHKLADYGLCQSCLGVDENANRVPPRVSRLQPNVTG